MNFSKKTLAISAVCIAVVAAVYIIIVLSGPFLVLREHGTGKVFTKLRCEYGNEFAITFTHSVNKTDVTETYEVRQDGIYLTGCIYYSFGAGVATELEDGWELSYGENGEMIITGIDRRIDELIYVVGTVSDHILTMRGGEYSLSELCGRSAKVDFVLED